MEVLLVNMITSMSKRNLGKMPTGDWPQKTLWLTLDILKPWTRIVQNNQFHCVSGAKKRKDLIGVVLLVKECQRPKEASP